MVEALPPCIVYSLGRVAYEPAWRLQERLADLVARDLHPPALLLLEHPHTYTLGRRATGENLLWDEAELARRGVAVHWVDRGGDITYHGPGQLVGYPILPLGRPALAAPGDSPRLPQADFVGYVRRLEETLIRALSSLGVPAGQRPGLTGVWVQPDARSRCVDCPPGDRQPPEKIASIGVKVDAQGISRHGFALNIDPDPAYWAGIIPCGLDGVRMAALANFLQPVPALDQVAACVEAAFGAVFGMQMCRKQADLELLGGLDRQE